ncbi:MAG: hypothetical protein IPK29_04190 [Betaproteobacteria bacterium]|nr:hypothetical protein [Betaproteobacteria bacterium]
MSSIGTCDGFRSWGRCIAVAVTLARLRRSQAQYFSSLTGGDYGAGCIEIRLAAGRAHHKIGLAPKWYIGAYRKYLSEMLPIAHQALGHDGGRFLRTLDALVKAITFDMGLALDTYFHEEQQALAEAHDYAGQVLARMPVGVVVFDKELPAFDEPLARGPSGGSQLADWISASNKRFSPSGTGSPPFEDGKQLPALFLGQIGDLLAELASQHLHLTLRQLRQTQLGGADGQRLMHEVLDHGRAHGCVPGLQQHVVEAVEQCAPLLRGQVGKTVVDQAAQLPGFDHGSGIGLRCGRQRFGRRGACGRGNEHVAGDSDQEHQHRIGRECRPRPACGGENQDNPAAPGAHSGGGRSWRP